MKYKTIGSYALAGAIAIATYGCNTLMRTAEGLGRLGERTATGVVEDWNSVWDNQKKEPYSLTGKNSYSVTEEAEESELEETSRNQDAEVSEKPETLKLRNQPNWLEDRYPTR